MKYMGSKNRIAKYLLPIILKDRKEGQWYVEPFVGGCNMIDKVKGYRRGNDSNEYLIDFFVALQYGWIPPTHVTKEQYSYVRNNMDENKALTFWVGVGCSYSGKWFGGYAGKTKTKIGTVRDYQAEAIDNINAQLEHLKGVVFTASSYDCMDIPLNSIIYCDPPYENSTSYKNKFDHAHFWEWVRTKSKDGHRVFVSEYNAPSDFICIW